VTLKTIDSPVNNLSKKSIIPLSSLKTFKIIAIERLNNPIDNNVSFIYLKNNKKKVFCIFILYFALLLTHFSE
jgi:hypothetical protein